MVPSQIRISLAQITWSCDRSRPVIRLVMCIAGAITAGMWGGATAFGQLPQPTETVRQFVGPPRELLELLEQFRPLVGTDETVIAVRSLQRLLDSPEDYFLDELGSGSLKQQASSLFRGFSLRQREAYEREFGPTAERLWERVQQNSDPADWMALLQRYSGTSAGRQAMDWAATLALDRQEPLTAIRLWAELIADDDFEPEPIRLRRRSQLAMAWSLAGHQEQATAIVRNQPELLTAANRALDAVPLEAKQSPEALLRWFQSQRPASFGFTSDDSPWTQPLGNGSRNRSSGSVAVIHRSAWKQSLWSDDVAQALPSPVSSETWQTWRELSRQVLEEAGENGQVELPAASALLTDEYVVARGPTGLLAFHADSGRVAWHSVLVDPSWQRLSQSLRMQQPLTPLLASEVKSWLRDALLRNARCGELSCDDRFVYGVEPARDDELMLPMAQVRNPAFMPVPQPPPSNVLVCWELHTGRVRWELGGPRGDTGLAVAGHYFLGPPLVHQGRLWCLTETSGEIRLLELQPDGDGIKVAWSQALAVPMLPLHQSASRRWSALTPSVCGSLLICPTESGRVVAVDITTRQLAWSYQYASEALFPDRQSVLMGGRFGRSIAIASNESLAGRWFGGQPIVSQGRLLLTPRDASEMHCLNTATGELLWKQPQGSAVFCAGVTPAGVVVVHQQRVEVWSWDDGQPLWEQPLATETVAGRGLVSPGRLLLASQQNHLTTYDLASGRLLGETPVSDSLGLGHLLAARGRLLSRGPASIEVWPRQQDLEAQLTRTAVDNGLSAEELAFRGELALHRGDTVAALRDLRAADELEASSVYRTQGSRLLVEQLRSQPEQWPELQAELQRWSWGTPLATEVLCELAMAQARTRDWTTSCRSWFRLIDLLATLDRHRGQRWPMISRSGLQSVRLDRVIRAELASLWQYVPVEQRTELSQVWSIELQQRLRADPSYEQLRTFGDVLTDSVPDEQSALLQPLWIALLSKTGSQLSVRARWLEELARSDDQTLACTAIAALADSATQRQRFSEARFWLDQLTSRYADAPCIPELLLPPAQIPSKPDGSAAARAADPPANPAPAAKAQTASEPSAAAPPAGNTAGDSPPRDRPQPGGPRPAGTPPATGASLAAEIAARLPPLPAREGWPATEPKQNRRNTVLPVTRMQPVQVVGSLPRWWKDWSFETNEQTALLARDGAGRLCWRLALASLMGSEFVTARGAPFAYQLAANEHWMVLNLGSVCLTWEIRGPGEGPQFLWQKPLLSLSRNEGSWTTSSLRSQWMASGRRRVRAVESLADRSDWEFLGLGRDVMLFRWSQQLIAVEPRDGALLWSRDVGNADFDAALNEQLVTTYHDDQTIRSWSLTDGRPLSACRSNGDPHTWLWLGPTAWAELDWRQDGLICAVHNVNHGMATWEVAAIRGSRFCVLEDELISVDPDGRCEARDLLTGQLRWSATLPKPVKLSFLWCQRHEQQRWIFAGDSLIAQQDVGISPYDGNQQPFTGLVAQLTVSGSPAGDALPAGATMATVDWSTEVDPTAFDVLQPPTLPIISFAARLLYAPGKISNPTPLQRTTATFLDRRTGEVLYSVEDAMQHGTFHLLVDGDRNQIVAWFQQWQYEMEWPEPPPAP
jgi:outer membrane protein assembly factor BamB